MATNQQRREAAKRKLERQLERRLEQQKRRRMIGAGVVGVAVLVVAGVVVWIVSANSSDGTDAAASSSAAPPPTELQIPTQRTALPKRATPLPNPTTCDFKADTTGKAPKKVNLPDGKNVPSTGTVNVTLKSTAGDIPLTLDRALAPCAVQSFVSLAKQNFYDGTMCHRLGTEGLQMLQCGDPAATGDPANDGQGGPGYTMPDEAFPEIKYGRGILAMAKTQAPNSGGSQFFMVYGNADGLSPDYSVFGSISDEGLKVLDAVAKAGIGNPNPQDGTGAPTKQVKFTGVTVS
ncbi:peptidylprolyl isomerase [Amycolatopsis tolypomycina]|uniref:Peptidyl-prolyl cis-trans isomerase B (Cyclophilin B) n=1 Tax=Amycolatopsis tolypomycina TaxID=208445 RepID=A0A1H4UGR7_9PSEU|nr:peptidylprolyl isomerase [Amycolatopsis tolypomycina]SEC67833.1 peptidyl-prolyl cis-trans isomerase B (cyclophilin B) [Amycolatopsis tolypomycina]